MAGGDGLHGNTRIAVTVQRPDKMMARAAIPGDTRCLYFDGKQLSMTDVQKEVLLDRSDGSAIGQAPVGAGDDLRLRAGRGGFPRQRPV